MVDVAGNLARIRERVQAAAARSGRSPDDITLIGVTKTVDLHRIQMAIEAGLTDIGENYIQEADAKFAALQAPVRRHFIGHLQSNKASAAVRLFDVIHTLDRDSLATAISKRAGEAPVEVLLQVNIGGEATKSGVAPDGAEALLRRLCELPGLQVRGLMAIPPPAADPQEARRHFRALHDLAARLRTAVGNAGCLHELSMGMTHDFEIAVEEGATMIRVGTGIFGPRV